MKPAVVLLLLFLYCSSSGAQSVDLTGTWTMFEMTYVTGQGDQKMTEEQMKANESVTDYFFMEGGKFKMTSNMSGSGTMDTYEGTWKLAENKLSLTLKIGERSMDVVWDFKYDNNIMNLSRTSPDGTITIVNTFRRK